MEVLHLPGVAPHEPFAQSRELGKSFGSGHATEIEPFRQRLPLDVGRTDDWKNRRRHDARFNYKVTIGGDVLAAAQVADGAAS